MFAAPEQWSEWNKASVDAALHLAKVSVDTAERVAQVQFETTKDAFADFAKTAKAWTEVRDPQELVGLRGKAAEASLEKWMGYSRSLYDVFSQSQAQLSSVFEQRIADLNKAMVVAVDKAAKSAPAGTDVAVAALKSGVAATAAAIDTFSKTAKQFASFTDASVKAATVATTTAAKSAKK